MIETSIDWKKRETLQKRNNKKIIHWQLSAKFPLTLWSVPHKVQSHGDIQLLDWIFIELSKLIFREVLLVLVERSAILCLLKIIWDNLCEALNENLQGAAKNCTDSIQQHKYHRRLNNLNQSKKYVAKKNDLSELWRNSRCWQDESKVTVNTGTIECKHQLTFRKRKKSKIMYMIEGNHASVGSSGGNIGDISFSQSSCTFAANSYREFDMYGMRDLWRRKVSVMGKPRFSDWIFVK